MDIEKNEPKSKNFQKHFKVFSVVILVCVSFFAGTFYDKHLSSKSASSNTIEGLLAKGSSKDQPQNVDFSLFWEAWNLLDDKYVDTTKIDHQKMIYGAISGMVKSIGDPFSSFMDPEESQQFSQELGGTFEGIGVEIGMKSNILTVISPLQGSPAEKAGLKAGDKILKVGDKLTSDMSVDEAVSLIRGPKGTDISLTILHDKSNTPVEVKITRDQINVKSVTLEWKDNNIAVIKISKFGDDTISGMNQIASQVVSQKAKGIILDLRNNPGGYLEAAVEVSSKFIPAGKVVVSEEERGGGKKEYDARGGDILSGIPVTVLVNSGSASASEITAGALRDDLGTQLIGKKTFGKGSVQELEKLSGGSNLRVTIARWLTPNGDYIMEKGIDPTIDVDLTDADYNSNRDPQMDKALEVIRGEIK
ncbi:MAG TPA: S41 family peptidase [Candidatus Saccharimonadales bacterium]|nr:S41 family peptidase [Candidatus Saccharimonadales bacterium]